MYALPQWFLIVALFMPRLALFIQWWDDLPTPFIQPFSSLCWFFLPRIMVLVMIFSNQGFSGWFFFHLIVGILVWLCGGTRVASSYGDD